MATVVNERRRTSRAPTKDSQQFQSTSGSLRTTSIDPNKTDQDFNRRSLTRSKPGNSGLESEYIKQLQEQIYYLETEGLYLRNQLSRQSLTNSRSLSNEHLNLIERDRNDLQRSLIQTSSHYDQLSSEKHGLQIALDDLRLKFDREKQTLLDEIDNLNRARQILDQEKVQRDQELRQTRDRARLSADELKTAENKIRVLEQQYAQQLNEFKILSDELRASKLESTGLQRSLSDYHLINRERDRLQGLVAELENELTSLRLELKTQDNRYSEVRTLRSRLEEDKGALMKEVTRLENLNKDFQRELDQIRLIVRERTETIQSKEKENAALRKKEQTYVATVESLQIRLDGERTKNLDLDGQIRYLQRQLNVESQTVLNTKRDLSEVLLKNSRLQEELNLLQREKDNFLDQCNALQVQLSNEEKLTASLRLEVRDFEERVKEIDRLKNLEDLIQSQRWADVTQMAQTMQSLGRTMTRATSPTTLQKRIEFQ